MNNLKKAKKKIKKKIYWYLRSMQKQEQSNFKFEILTLQNRFLSNLSIFQFGL